MGFKEERTSGLMRTTEALSERLNKHASAEHIEELEVRPAVEELKRRARFAAEAAITGTRDKQRRETELLAAAIRFYEAEKLLRG